MRGISPEKKDLLLKIGERLLRYGIEAYTLDVRQLKTYDQILTAMDEMAAMYGQKKKELDQLVLNKANIAAKANLSVSTLRHDTNASRLIEAFSRDRGMVTTDPVVVDVEKESMRKTIREQAAQIMDLQHKYESQKHLSLDLYAKEKQLQERDRELTLTKQKVAVYYELLDEIKRNDTNWTSKIQQMLSGQLPVS